MDKSGGGSLKRPAVTASGSWPVSSPITIVVSAKAEAADSRPA